MNWKLMGITGLFIVTIVTIVLALGQRSRAQAQAQASNMSHPAYLYKVERMNRNAKEMDHILSNDGKDGWRVWRVEAVGPSNNDLVFVLEKPAPSN